MTTESNVQQAVVDALRGEGVTADTKTPTLKGTYKELTGESLDDAGVEAYRQALRDATNADPNSTAPAAKNVKKAKNMATPKKAAPKTAGAKTKAATKAPAKAAPKEPKEKVEKTPLTDEERMTIANKVVKERKADADFPGWANVKRVIETGKDGAPIRVVIACTDKQTTRDGKSVCAGEKEIAAQDVFQTKRCIPCQKRHQQVYRNELAKRRRAANPKPVAVKKAAPAKAPKKAAPKKAAKAK